MPKEIAPKEVSSLLLITGNYHTTKSQLDGWKESLEFDTVPKHLARELADYRKMICFHDRHRIDIPQGSEWAKYSYIPEVLKGEWDNYYHVFRKNILDIEKERILSFHDYKNHPEPDGKLKFKALQVVHSR